MDEVLEVAPLVKHMHIHDNYGKPCYYHEKTQVDLVPLGKGDMHLPIGWGKVPFYDIISQLQGYSGMLINEVRPRYMASLSELLSKYGGATL